MNNDDKRRGLDFGDALRALRAGHVVQREGWNGKGMWLRLVPSQELENRMPKRTYIELKDAGDALVPWVPSQTDMLAHDWRILDGT